MPETGVGLWGQGPAGRPSPFLREADSPQASTELRRLGPVLTLTPGTVGSQLTELVTTFHVPEPQLRPLNTQKTCQNSILPAVQCLTKML